MPYKCYIFVISNFNKHFLKIKAMYTKEELEKKPSILLRKIAGEAGVKNASKMDKVGMITEILKAQAQKEQETPVEEIKVVEVDEVEQTEEVDETVEVDEENGEEESEEPVVLKKAKVALVKEDRHGKPLEPGYEVSANINGKWYDGVVDGFKVLDDETYTYVTLTKFGKQKMFLQHEVEFKKVGEPKPKPVMDVKKLTDLDSADAADLAPEIETPVKRPKSLNKKPETKKPETKKPETTGSETTAKYTKLDEVPDFGIKKGDKVKFMTRKGEEIVGSFLYTTWDKQSNSPYSYIKGDDNKVYSKKPGTLTLVV